MPKGAACIKKRLKFCETPEELQYSSLDNAISGKDERTASTQRDKLVFEIVQGRVKHVQSSKKAAHPPCKFACKLHISSVTSISNVRVAPAFLLTGSRVFDDASKLTFESSTELSFNPFKTEPLNVL
jgi:hypothetical protein